MQKKMAIIHSRVILLILCRCTLCFGVLQWQDLKENYYKIVSNKYVDAMSLLPRSFTNQTVSVQVSMNLASINSFDELMGYLEVSGYLTIKWTETPVRDYFQSELSPKETETETLMILKSGIWTPPLLLMNSIKTTSTIGDATSMVRLDVQSGWCTWNPWMVIRGSCSPDVRYYPFDKQLCSFKFAAWGHTRSEVSLNTTASEWSTDFFDENGEWEILSTSSNSYISNNVSFVEFKIELLRRPTYYVINLLAPVILLGLLNVFVFVLPAESGERIGFSITCFLSYVVLLNTIMAFLPTTSAPLSYLSYYTFIMMIFSAAMSLSTVVTMRIYVKKDSDPVPAFLRGILYIATCKCCADATSVVTWKTVARIIDLIMFLGFLGGQIFYSVYETSPLTCNCIHSLQDDDIVKEHLPVTQMRFKHHEPGDKVEHTHILMASYASGLVKFWHYTSGKCLHTIAEPNHSQVLTLAVNPENTHFITTGDDPRVHFYDMKTLQKVGTMEPSDSRNSMDGHHARVFALMYNPTMPHVFISGGWDDTVQYWDDRLKHSQRHISGPHICGDALDIDPKHNHILSGSWCTGTTLQIWDFASAQKIKDVPPEPLNNTMVYCCQWLGHDSIVCGGHNHNMARIIDRGTLNTTGQLLDLHQSVYCIDNDHQGYYPKVAIGSQKYIYLVKEEKKSS